MRKSIGLGRISGLCTVVGFFAILWLVVLGVIILPTRERPMAKRGSGRRESVGRLHPAFHKHRPTHGEERLGQSL